MSKFPPLKACPHPLFLLFPLSLVNFPSPPPPLSPATSSFLHFPSPSPTFSPVSSSFLHFPAYTWRGRWLGSGWRRCAETTISTRAMETRPLGGNASGIRPCSGQRDPTTSGWIRRQLGADTTSPSLGAAAVASDWVDQPPKLTKVTDLLLGAVAVALGQRRHPWKRQICGGDNDDDGGDGHCKDDDCSDGCDDDGFES